jgi:hypothetical protein
VRLARYFLLASTIGLVLSLAPGVDAFLAVGSDPRRDHGDHEAHGSNASPEFVRVVRNATEQFLDANAATAMGYLPDLGCVSGSQEGASGRALRQKCTGQGRSARSRTSRGPAV